MKLSIVVAIIVASAGCVAPSSPTTKVAPPLKQAAVSIAIVADFRGDHPHPVRAALAIHDADLLARLFPQRLANEAQCPQRAENSTLESERSLGLVVPEIAAAVAGSFIAPYREEVAVIVRVGECRPYGFESDGSKNLVVLSGNQIVWPPAASSPAEISENDFASVLDVDDDGIDELVLEGGGMHMGHLVVTARIVSLANGSLRDLFPQTDVVADDCPTDEPGATSRAAWIELARGRTPRFLVHWTEPKVCPRD